MESPVNRSGSALWKRSTSERRRMTNFSRTLINFSTSVTIQSPVVSWPNGNETSVLETTGARLMHRFTAGRIDRSIHSGETLDLTAPDCSQCPRRIGLSVENGLGNSLPWLHYAQIRPGSMSHVDNYPRGYACGRRTRERIITAALQVFGEAGYDRGSTRRIAERAGVNTPAIRYYFGSKRGLHAACARQVIARVESILALPLVHAGDVLRAPAPAAALGALCELLAALVDGLAVAGAQNWKLDLAHEHVGARLFDTIERLVAAATPHSLGAELPRLRACMLLGYVSSLYENRARTLDVMGWSRWDAEALTLMKSVIREQARGALATTCLCATQA